MKPALVGLLLLSFLSVAWSVALLWLGSRWVVRKPLHLKVRARCAHGPDWFTLELVRATRWAAVLPLPRFRAGQSIRIFAGAPSDARAPARRYSLARWQRLPFSYRVTIKREPQGGVSQWLYEHAHVGCVLRCSQPSGHFVDQTEASTRATALVAAGVGITPIAAMWDAASARRRAVHAFWQLRDAQHLSAWFDRPLDACHEVNSTNAGIRVRLTGIVGGRRWRATDVVQSCGGGAGLDVYLCASQAFLDEWVPALEAAGVARERIFFEHFGAASARDPASAACNVSIGATHGVFGEMPNLLAWLELHDRAPPSDCRSGTCGRCLVRIVEGEVITSVACPVPGFALACVSRPKTNLVLARE